jgi:hypothetical protein
MRSRTSVVFVLLAASVAGMWSAHAQTAPQVQRGPDSSSNTYVPGIDILPLTGAPFSGTDKIVWTRPTGGGGSVTVSLEAKAVRDSEGRLYRERHCFCPAGLDPEKTLQEFTISDTVTKLRITCVKSTHWCHVTKYQPQISVPAQPAVGPYDQGRRNLTRESLGTKYIDNYPVVGTLETMTMAAETVGNDQPIALSREFWYSSDLKTNLAVTRKDPRDGTQAVTLAILSRNEPDASIFTVPAAYGIVDDRGVVLRQPQAAQPPTLSPPPTN